MSSIIIKRPKVTVIKPEDKYGYYTIVIDDVTLLSALTLKWWLANSAQSWKINIDTTALNTDIMNSDFYIPKMDKDKMIDYIKTAKKAISAISESSVDPNHLFGLLPMNVLTSIVFEMSDTQFNLPTTHQEENMFPKRIDRYEFPVSDFGYVLAALTKTKRENGI